MIKPNLGAIKTADWIIDIVCEGGTTADQRTVSCRSAAEGLQIGDLETADRRDGWCRSAR